MKKLFYVLLVMFSAISVNAEEVCKNSVSCFDITVQRYSKSYALMTIVCYNLEPVFVCNDDFRAIQGGVEYNNINIFMCGDVIGGLATFVGQTTDGPQMDISKAYTLIYDGVDELYSFEVSGYIPANSGSGVTTEGSAASAGGDGGSSGCFINMLK